MLPDDSTRDAAPGEARPPGARLFDSRKEAKRYLELLPRWRAGEIQALDLQKRIRLIVNGIVVCTYVADFAYIEKGKRVVEDVKSRITRKLPVYILKKKLLKAIYGVEIMEV